MPDDLLTTGAAAELVGVTPETIRKWAAAHQVPHITLPSGRLRFHRADVEALLTVTPAAEHAGEAS